MEKSKGVLRLLVETFYDYQKGRQAFANRLNRFPKEIKKKIEKETLFKNISTGLKDLENSLEKAIKEELKNEDMYTKVLSRIVGIGPIMSADIIAWVCKDRDFTMGSTHPMLEQIKKLPYAEVTTISKLQSRVKLPPVLDIAKYPSDFYKYSGLIPGSRKVKGKQISYNPKVKTHFWKMIRQIIMAKKSNYATMYAKEKVKFLEKYQKEYDDAVAEIKKKAKTKKEQNKLIKEAKLGSPRMKAHLTAIKRTARHLALTIYLSHKYFNKQKAYLPYPITVLGHTVQPPFVDGEEREPEHLDFLVEYAEPRTK